MGGLVPDVAMKFATKKALSTVDRVRDHFERNGSAVDAELRAVFPPPPSFHALLPDQTSAVQRSLPLEADEENQTWVPLKSESAFVASWANYHPPAVGKRNMGIGKSECDCDCSAQEVLAHYFAVTSRANARVSAENGDLALIVLDRTTPHDFTWTTVKNMPFPLRPREFVGRYVRHERSEYCTRSELWGTRAPHEPSTCASELWGARHMNRAHVRASSGGCAT
jgi:hypothetical protein